MDAIKDANQFRVLIPEDRLQARIEELGAKIRSDYGDRPIVCICVLKGSFMFTADLVRAIGGALEVEREAGARRLRRRGGGGGVGGALLRGGGGGGSRLARRMRRRRHRRRPLERTERRRAAGGGDDRRHEREREEHERDEQRAAARRRDGVREARFS